MLPLDILVVTASAVSIAGAAAASHLAAAKAGVRKETLRPGAAASLLMLRFDAEDGLAA